MKPSDRRRKVFLFDSFLPMKEHSYSLYIMKMDGSLEPILEHEKSIRRVRNVALKIKERPGRKVRIERDGKLLPGGARALDNEAYQMWLEEHDEV